MSIVKKLMTGLAAMSLVAVPVAAEAASASKLSISKSVRTGKASANSEKIRGSGAIVAILAVVAIIAGAVIIANNDDEPKSP